jgi:type 1 glutamine amidotransferase
MRTRHIRLRWAVAALAAAAVAVTPVVSEAAGSATHAKAQRPIRVLIFSKAYAFVHPSIKTGAKFFTSLNGGGEFRFTNSTDPKDLRVSNLRHYDVLLWNSSTGNVPLSNQDRAALLDWVRHGHGFVGIHAAGDGEYDWPQFSELVGGEFLMHWYDFGGITTEPQTEVLRNEDPDSAMTRHLPLDWKISDETYAWQVNPRPDVHVLLSLVNSSIAEGALYAPNQPLAWCRPFGSGRTFYTNQGHIESLFQNPDYVTEVLQGIRYAAGRVPVDCSVPGARSRDEAVWADGSVDAKAARSNESGGMAVVTAAGDKTRLTWDGVNLSRIHQIEVHATGTVEKQPPGSGSPAQWGSTGGGTIELHADSADGKTVGTVSVAPGSDWTTTSVDVPASLTGRRDLVLTFTPNVPGDAVGSIAWIRLVPTGRDAKAAGSLNGS